MTDILSRAGALLVEADRDTKPSWYDDPAAFADELIIWPPGEGLTPYQRELMQALVEHRRVSARGPHGLGKSCLAALLLLWFALGRELAGENWKVLSTAGGWRQLTAFLWPEVHLWARRLNWDKLGRPPFDPRTELMQTLLRLRNGQAIAGASNDAQLLEGAHADQIFILFDEAKSIPAPTWEALEGAMAGTGTSYALAISTPGSPSGVFYDIHSRRPGYEDWHVRHVTLGEAIAAGRISATWAEARRRQWGATSALYLNRVEGQFASSDEDSVIPLEWVEQAVMRWEAWQSSGEEARPVDVLGVDVARSGADSSVLALRSGNVITELRRYTKSSDTMALVGHVANVLDANEGCKAVIDVVGMGGPVLDRLREMGYKRAYGFNAAAGTDRKDRSGELAFLNLRAAAWWYLREVLDPAFDPVIALPNDDQLIGELVTPKYALTSAGKLKIESKDELRARLGRSTDSADAVIMALYEGSRPGQGHAFAALWQTELAEREKAASKPVQPVRPFFGQPLLGDAPPEAIVPTACPGHRFFDMRCAYCGAQPSR